HSTDSCPRLGAEVSGGTILGAGGQMVNPSPLPNPVTTPSPTVTASPAANAPTLPTGLQIVEQTSTSITLQWEFGSERVFYRLFLDGREVVAHLTNPNYYRFEGLSPSTAHILGVQAVNLEALTSQIASLSATTLSSGHSGSGNFSGGGSTQLSSPVPLDEFIVNTDTGMFHNFPGIAMDSTGDFVVVWQSSDQDGSDYGIYAQRYSASGKPHGNEFRVNDNTNAKQHQAAVAMDDDGDFVVTWTSDNQDSIFAKRFDSRGRALAGEFRVNTFSGLPHRNPDVALDHDGDFVITWQSYGQDGHHYGIFAQRYNNRGQALGSDFPVNTSTTGSQSHPAIAMDRDGDFVINWTGRVDDSNSYGVFAQRFASNAQARGSEFRVDDFSINREEGASIACDKEGDFVISWDADGFDGDSYAILARRFDSNGTPAGSGFQVNTSTTSLQVQPSVAMNADGDFIISWVSFQAEAPGGEAGRRDGGGIFAQRFDQLGNLVGTEFQVNTFTTGRQSIPEVAINQTGNFAIIWKSPDQDRNALDIKAQLYLHGENLIP
ncbi:MAG: hypothetical protein ACAI44_12660, partial [Candidatus Sericytochromatia bacterium]